jgi:O-antigen/teichoic acid export membrane protein
MKTFLKSAAKHTAIFGLGDLLNRVIGLVLLPIYLRYLSPADYGLLELLGILSLLLGMIILQGIPTASFKGVNHTYLNSKDDQKEVVGTAYLYLSLSSFIYFAACFLLSDYISNILFSEGDYSKLVKIVFITGFFNTLNNIPGVVFRAYLRSLKAIVVSFLNFGLNCALKIYFVVFLGMGVEGILWGGLITAVIFFFVSPVLIWQDIKWKISFNKLKPMLSYGWPLIPGAIAGGILNGADRLCLEYFSTRSQLGIYSLGFQLAAAINFLFLGPFQKTWPALFFPIADQPDAPKILGRFSTYFFCVGFCLSLFLICMAKPLLMLIAPVDYLSAYLVVPILVVALLLNGFQHLLNVGIFVKDQTKYAPLIVIAGATINVLLNVILIPAYGIFGAGIATLISSFVMVILSYALNKRFYTIDYEFGRIFYLSVIFILFSLADLVIPYSTISDSLPFIFQYKEVIVFSIIKFVIIICFPLAIYLSNLFDSIEKREINTILLKIPLVSKVLNPFFKKYSTS